MTDCDKARQAVGLPRAQCCCDCHERDDLTELVLKGVGFVRVCCATAALIHPADQERPTRPYGVDQPSSQTIPAARPL